MNTSLRTAILFSLLYISINCCAQGYKNQISVITENDAYIDITKDRYYTNGFFIGFKRLLNAEANHVNVSKKILGIDIAQKIYNPYYSLAPDPSLHDRPFAAYLYGEANLSKFYKNNSVLKYSIQLGVNGTNALGETFQKAYHGLVGQNKVVGWEYGLKGEPVVNFGLGYDKLLFVTKNQLFDVIASGEAHLGNMNTNIAIGSIFRLGKINKLDNTALFGSRVAQRETKRSSSELFVFIKPQLHTIIYDASVEGRLLSSNKGPVTFHPKRFVFTTQAGGTFAIQRWTLNYTAIFTTKEVKSVASAYKYASMGITYGFN